MNRCQDQNKGTVKYCQPLYNKAPYTGDYPVDVKSNIAPELRASTPYESLPTSPVNGGLFSGPPATGPWGAIPVPPSGTYYVHYNLRSAHPPPGAIYHYIGYNREGNSYQTMPGIFWLNDSNSKYPSDNRYHIKFIKDSQNFYGER
jgi:hypothetical protein